MNTNTLPPCLGQGEPQTPDACQKCEFKLQCEYIRANFVAKGRLLPIYEKLEKILMGVHA
jgi:hypothetical protein